MIPLRTISQVGVHLDSLSNGMGGQSMWALALAARGDIVATISMTSDTGAEEDCQWSTGRRSTARIFFEEVIVPYCDKHDIIAAFPRTRYKDGREYPPLGEELKKGKPKSVPLFGSKMGRLMQTCTDKWKIRAMKQEARRRLAKTMRSAIGLHVDEKRRVKGRLLGREDGFAIFQSGETDKKSGKFTPWKWMTHFYPLIDLGFTRDDCRKNLDQIGLPYLVSSECDFCPHKDAARWLRTSPEMIDQCADLEANFAGQFFLTDQRIPLKMAIENMRAKPDAHRGDEDFGCENDRCGH